MRIKSLPESERPVEKTFRRGIDRLSNAELIALIIHTGTKDKSAIRLSEEVLGAFPEGIGALGSCMPEDLLRIEGIGRVKACSILASVELGKRISSFRADEKISIKAPDRKNVSRSRKVYITSDKNNSNITPVKEETPRKPEITVPARSVATIAFE